MNRVVNSEYRNRTAMSRANGTEMFRQFRAFVSGVLRARLLCRRDISDINASEHREYRRNVN